MSKLRSSALGPLEQEVMDCIWQHGSQKVSQVYSCISERHPLAYTTVMTVMNRLVQKGLLNRTKQGKAYIYTPTSNKKQTIKTLVRQTITNLVSQFGQEALVAFSDELEQVNNSSKNETN